MIESIARLRSLIRRLPELGPDGDWAAERLARYLEHARDGLTLDEALEVKPRPGRRHWWTLEDLARRDALIRRCANEACGNLGIADQALELSAVIGAYRRRHWEADRRRGEPAPARAGTPAALLFEASRLCDGELPISKKMLSRILRDGK